MSVIDPDSPLDWTICGMCQERHELGGVDCSGVEIGYVTPSCAWEDRHEHDVAVGSGRAWDAWLAWARMGGLLGEEPDVWPIIREVCLPQWEDEAYESFMESVGHYAHPVAVRARAEHAMWN